MHADLAAFWVNYRRKHRLCTLFASYTKHILRLYLSRYIYYYCAIIISVLVTYSFLLEVLLK